MDVNKPLTSEEVNRIRVEEKRVEREQRAAVQGPARNHVPPQCKSPNPENCPIAHYGRPQGAIPSHCFWVCGIESLT